MNRSEKLKKELCKRKTTSIVEFVFLFFLAMLSSCTEQLAPHKVPQPPTAQELDQRLVQKINHLLAIKNYSGAKRELSQIHSPSLRESMRSKVRLDWDINDIRTADEDLKKGLGVESLDTIESLKKRDPDFIRNHPELIPNDLTETYLDSLISTGKEFQALKESKDSFRLPKDLERAVETDAYTHLAKRRIDEGKDHFALLDIKKGLLIDPSNEKLARMKSILKKKENYLTEEGFKQYGKQHLRRAIRYWNDALLLSPGDKGLQKNITQAQKMLERLKSLQHIDQISKNSTAK